MFIGHDVSVASDCFLMFIVVPCNRKVHCLLPQSFFVSKLSPWIYKGVSATLQSDRYTLSYRKGKRMQIIATITTITKNISENRNLKWSTIAMKCILLCLPSEEVGTCWFTFVRSVRLLSLCLCFLSYIV